VSINIFYIIQQNETGILLPLKAFELDDVLYSYFMHRVHKGTGKPLHEFRVLRLRPQLRRATFRDTLRCLCFDDEETRDYKVYIGE
jgi:hypothetical protein